MTRDGRTSTPPDRLGPRTIPLEGGLGRAVTALAAGFQFRTSDWPDETGDEWPVYESGVRLARAIADAALEAPGAPGDGDLARAAQSHAERVLDLARKRREEPFSLSTFEPTKDDLGRTTAALREQALEHHDAELFVAEHESGAHVLLAAPVTEQQAHVWLLGPLYEKVEAWLQEDPVTSLERDACAWWFSRWRGSRPLEGDEFPRGVREQEFALSDREMCILGASPLDHLVEEGRLRSIGPRQQHLAAQMAASEVGVWIVQARTEDRAVFASPLDGRRYEVREHASLDGNSYGPGYIALGRLIPFGDGTWLRSPGAFLMRYGSDSSALARSLAEGLHSKRGDLPLAPALELAAHTLAGIRNLPRSGPPAPTPDHAAEYGRAVTELLSEAGIARPVDPASARAARLAAENPDTNILEYAVDIVLGEYMGALFQQSQNSKAIRDLKRRRARQARKKGKGRR